MRQLLLNCVFMTMTVLATAAAPKFVNPIYEGADPWIIKHDNIYYGCQSKGDAGILIWKSDKLTDKGTRRVVWERPEEGWNKAQVWAPELHFLRGKWYIYYAASDGKNENHRMGVLEAETNDPQGRYIDRGMLYTGDDITKPETNRWAIDGTPLEIGGQLYFVWSGWEDDRDIQYLYIAPMENPYTISGNRARIAANDDYVWERVNNDLNERGLAEGPQVLERDGRLFIVYSTSASWLRTYKLGLLELVDKSNPMAAKSWKKYDHPVFQGSREMLGTGHACFVKSPDNTEDWIVFHSKISPQPGWLRAVWVQKFHWTTDGLPYFGEPVPRGVVLDAPSGEKANVAGKEFTDTFEDKEWDEWVFYGYSLFVFQRDGAFNIGGRPNAPVANDYRSGEKALVRGFDWKNLEIRSKVQVQETGSAGIIFRARYPHVAEAGFLGYYVGIDAAKDAVTLTKSNGVELKTVATVSKELEPKTWYDLKITAVGDKITVLLNGESLLEANDGSYREGMAGVRVSEAHGAFDDFTVRAAE